MKKIFNTDELRTQQNRIVWMLTTPHCSSLTAVLLQDIHEYLRTLNHLLLTRQLSSADIKTLLNLPYGSKETFCSIIQKCCGEDSGVNKCLNIFTNRVTADQLVNPNNPSAFSTAAPAA